MWTQCYFSILLSRLTLALVGMLLIFTGTVFAAGAQPSFSHEQAIEAPDGSIFQIYAISGTVRDTNGIPIAGSQVIGFGSPGNLVLTQSSANGQYTLYASQDTYHVQASRQGYFAGHVFGVIVPPSHTVVDFALTPIAPAFSLYLPIVLKICPESNNIVDAITVSSGQTACGQVSASSDLDDVYRIAIAAGQQLTISMNGTGGDADLYLYPPGTSNVNTDPYVDFSENIGNNEFIQGTALVGGFWYIDVYAFSGTSNYNVTATLSGLNSAETKTFNLSGVAGNSKGDKTKSSE